MTHPKGNKTELSTIAYSVFTDEQGVRVRCCFCGGVLASHTDRIEHTDIHDFVDTLTTHPCFQPGANLLHGAYRQLEGRQG